MMLRKLAAIAVLGMALTACEDDPQTSGEIVGPLVGPRIAESQLALDIVDGAPAGITDIFFRGDFVNLWVHWTALEPPHEVEAVWWDPLDNFFPTTLDITENVAEQVTVFTLELSDQSTAGRWEVEIYIDGEFMRSHIFDVVTGS
jgi:hypothetical protein